MSIFRIRNISEEMWVLNLTSIHIGALAKFTGDGPGDYVLSSIKQMTATENFLDLPEDERGCALQTYEECKIKGFLGHIARCGCSPFQLFSTSDVDQVHIFLTKAAKISLSDLLTGWHGLYAREISP